MVVDNLDSAASSTLKYPSLVRGLGFTTIQKCVMLLYSRESLSETLILIHQQEMNKDSWFQIFSCVGNFDIKIVLLQLQINGYVKQLYSFCFQQQ